MKSLITICALCLVLVAPAYSEENTTPEKLIEQLAAEDFDVREAATATLIKLGEKVWPKLEPFLDDSDAERAQRVRGLAAQLAIVRPDQQPLLNELISKLENENEEMKRAEGLDGLIKLGLPGIRVLRNHLSGANSALAPRLDLPHTSVTAGESIFGRALLINEGSRPMWRRKYAQFLRFSTGEASPFGEERDKNGFGMRCGSGRRLMVRRGGYYNPIREWCAVSSKSIAEDMPVDVTLSTVGIYNATLSVSVPENAIISPRIPDSTETIDFSIGASIEKDKPQPSMSVQLFGLPDLTKPPEDSTLRMNLARADKAKLTAGKVVKLNASLTSRVTDSRVCLERNLTRYAWYAVLDGGVPVKWGSWESVLEIEADKRDTALEPREVAAGAAANWTLAIPLPTENGTYTVVIGYERDDTKIAPAAEDPFVHGLGLVPYDTGSLYTSIEINVGR